MKKYLVLALLFVSVCANATDEWSVIAEVSAQHLKFVGLNDSANVTTIDSQRGIIIVGKVVNTENNGYKNVKWFVPAAHCDDKEGSLYTFAADGSLMYKNNFEIDGPSVASSIASVVCVISDIVIKQPNA